MAGVILAPPAASGTLFSKLPDTTVSTVGIWTLGHGPNRERIEISFDEIMASHVAVEGSTGTGKTELLKALIDACGGWQGAVILDCTASPHLRRYAQTKPYVDVWSFGGKDVVYNPFVGDPIKVASRLTEAEQWVQAAEVYRGAAERTMVQALLRIDQEHRPRNPAVLIQVLEELRAESQGSTVEGIRGIVDRLMPVAMAGSWSLSSHGLTTAGVRIEDAIQRGRVVLFSLDCLTLSRAAQRVGAWIILDVERVASELGGAWPFLFAVDEAAKLDKTASHLRTCVAQLRQFGCGTMIFTQGEGDLDVIGEGKKRQIMQSIGIRVGLRQQAEEDQALWSRRVLGMMQPTEFRQLHDLDGVLVQHARRDDERIIRFRMQVRQPVPLPSLTAVPSAPPKPLPWWKRFALPAATVQPIPLPDLPNWLDDDIGRRFWKRARVSTNPKKPGCIESSYRPNQHGYPGFSFTENRDQQDWLCHIYAKARSDGRDLKEIRRLTTMGKLTVDHRCKNRLCFWPEHTQWKLRADHGSLEWERRRLAKDGIVVEGV